MVAVEGVEGAQRSPARAELLVGVAAEATDVRAHEAELEEGGKGQHCADGLGVVAPLRLVVSQPVTNLGARAGKGAARDDQGAETRSTRQHSIVRGRRHHGAVEVVGVVHGQAVLVDQVGVDGVVGDATLVRVPRVLVGGLVVDGVLGVQEITAGKTLLVTLALVACTVSIARSRVDDGQTAAASVDLERLNLAIALVGTTARLEIARPAGQRTRRRADRRWGRRITHSGGIRVGTGEVAREVAGLVHVDPQSVNVQAGLGVEKGLELAVPVRLSVRGEPIREDGDTRPDNTDPDGAVSPQQEHVVLEALVGRRVVLVGDGWVDHDDVVLVICVQVVNELTHHGHGETVWVDGKDAAAVHVINVRPHGLEGNAGQAVVLNNFGDVVGVLVSISALVETEAPVWLHGREASKLTILLHCCYRSRPSNKVKVEHATNGVVLKVLVARSVLVDHDVHAVGVEEEDTMGARGTVLQVEGVRSVEIGVVGNAIAVLVPHSADVVGRLEAQRVRMLAQAVQVGVRG